MGDLRLLNKISASLVFLVFASGFVGCNSEKGSNSSQGNGSSVPLSVAPQKSQTESESIDPTGAEEESIGEESSEEVREALPAGLPTLSPSPSASPSLTVSSSQIPEGSNTYILNPFGRVAGYSMNLERTNNSAVILSSGALATLGGRYFSGLFGRFYRNRGDTLRLGDPLSYFSRTESISEIPLNAQLAALPGGKALLLGGERSGSLGENIAGPYAPSIVDFSAEEMIETLDVVSPASCNGSSTSFFGAVAIEPFSGSISNNTMGSPDAQWKIGILRPFSDLLWIFDTQTKSFSCFNLGFNIPDFNTVKLAALSTGSLFIWNGNQSKIFDPSGNSGNGELLDVADPAQPTRSHAGVVGISAGKVAVFGGLLDASNELTSIEVYDPATHSWTSSSASLQKGRYKLRPRYDRTTGKVVLLGGHSLAKGDATVELGIDAWDPLTDTLSDTTLGMSLDPWATFSVPYAGGPMVSNQRHFEGVAMAPSATSGSIYWVGDAHAGSRNVVGYEPAAAADLSLSATGAGPYRVELLEGVATLLSATPDNPAFTMILALPFQSQPKVKVKVTDSNGVSGDFEFAVSLSP